MSFLINTIKMLAIFDFGFFLFLFGVEWIVKKSYLYNICFLFDDLEHYEFFLKKMKIPYNGWIVTFIISYIPFLNILYLFTILFIGLSDVSNEKLIKIKEALKKLEKR